MVNIGKRAEQGSASVTALVAVFALGLSSLYVLQEQQKLNGSVHQARVKANSDSASLSNMNAVAQFKALLNNSKVGAEYLPALYPQNYWLANWSQISKNPQIPSEDVMPLNGSEWFKINLADTSNLSSAQLQNLMAGTKSQTQIKPQDGYIRVVKANFKRSLAFDYVDTVDVEVKTTKETNGQSSTIFAQARIPVPVPQPSHPVLEVSPQGANTWSQNWNGIQPGAYDMRVTASGVVYKAVIMVNDEDPLELGVFDLETGEPTNHAATNVLAKNQVIGQVSYQFQGFVSNAQNCSMAPTDGQYKIRAVLYNAKGEVSEAPEHETEVTFFVKTGLALGKDLTDEEFKSACSEECPYYDGLTYEDAAVADAQDHRYGDYARDHQMFMRRDQIKVKSVKFCENARKPAETFFGKFGRTVASWDELVGSSWDRVDYVYYTVPQCQRKFLFARGACGCFAEETLITLGDGVTQKRITELSEADQVWNPMTKKAQSIRRMTRGPEKVPMFDVTVAGKTVRVTGQHPFPTASGVKQAFALQESDGIDAIQLVEKTADDPIVWNLELDGDKDDQNHYVLANGVVTGDLFIQTRLSGSEK